MNIETSGSQDLSKYKETKGTLVHQKIGELEKYQNEHFGINFMTMNMSLNDLRQMVQVKILSKQLEITQIMNQLSTKDISEDQKAALKKKLDSLQGDLSKLKEYEEIYTKKKQVIFLGENDFDQ